MCDDAVDNEFGEVLSGAGCRPQFANLVRYKEKYVSSQRDFPVSLNVKSVRLEVSATDIVELLDILLSVFLNPKLHMPSHFLHSICT